MRGNLLTMQEAGWLQISTEGFAAFNQARPPGHLVKELVQNAFDAVTGNERGARVALDYWMRDGLLWVGCIDTGGGVHDLSALRVVYLTFKTDSHLKRGRFGRGFKEILSVARSAEVTSGEAMIEFVVENGAKVTRRREAETPLNGTSVLMSFDWPEDIIGEFDRYFRRFLPPENVEFLVNGSTLFRRAPTHVVDATLPTEVYDPTGHAWRKPQRKTAIHLIATQSGDEAFIYEMGIPVALAEWSEPFHIDVQQRVPMNPNRDALASGYALKVHAACLPTILASMTQEQATADWVGAASTRCEPEVQREIVNKAFGEHAVRQVPVMGKRDFNDDAQRFGAVIVNTAQMSAGFREIAKAHLPTAKTLVDTTEVARAQAAATQRFTPQEVTAVHDERRVWIERQGGSARIETCLSFAVWFCQQLVNSTGIHQPKVTGHCALGRAPPPGRQAFEAHWSADNALTVALEADRFWSSPLSAWSLSLLIHEAAHAMNLHHGRGFNEEVERLGGIAASAMFRSAEQVRERWPTLLG